MREEFISGNYLLAVGKDAFVGPFVQLWKHPIGEQERSILSINNSGLHVHEEPPDFLMGFLENLQERFRVAKSRRQEFPNLDEETVCEFARHFGKLIYSRVKSMFSAENTTVV